MRATDSMTKNKFPQYTFMLLVSMICSSSDIVNGLDKGLFYNSTITRAVKSLTPDSILISTTVITSVGDSLREQDVHLYNFS